ARRREGHHPACLGELGARAHRAGLVWQLGVDPAVAGAHGGRVGAELLEIAARAIGGDASFAADCHVGPSFLFAAGGADGSAATRVRLTSQPHAPAGWTL